MQSHTYWHPNFDREKKRLSPREYDKFVDMQLRKSREKLEKELGTRVDMLAWPFGLHNDDLEKESKRVRIYCRLHNREASCASCAII